MSPIARGPSPVTACYRGNVEISAIYRGSALVWARSAGVPTGFEQATVNVAASVRSFASSSQNYSGTDTGTTTARTATRPPQVEAGDLLVMFGAADGGTAANFTPPSGWTSRYEVVPSTGGYVRMFCYTKVATANEPATWNFASYPNVADGCALVLAIKDWDGIATNLTFASSAATSTAWTAPSVTPKTARNVLLCQAAHSRNGSGLWSWRPPASMGLSGYVTNANSYNSTCAAIEVWDSALATGTRTFTVDTNSTTYTTRLAGSVLVASGTRTATLTQFLSEYDYTGGTGGELTDATGLTFQDSTGLTSTYHLFAAGLDWSKNVGLLIYTDGSAEFGLSPAQITNQSPYLLYGSTGLIAVAKKHNMVLLTPRAPGTGCADGDGVCWYDHSPDSNTSPFQKMEWSNELIRWVMTRYNIDRRRIAFGGYSSGAQWTTAWWGPRYAAEVMKDGVAVAISYGGVPRVPVTYTSAFKSAVPVVWDVGSTDTAYSQPRWDDSVQSGRAWYETAGFATAELVLVADKGHDRYNTTTMVGEFGPIMDREITAKVPPA